MMSRSNSATSPKLARRGANEVPPTVWLECVRKLTWRRMAFVGIVAYIGCYPIYSYIESQLRGGIRRRGDLISVDLQEMGDFEMNQVLGTSDSIPRRFRDLEGRRVVLVGEMWTPLTSDAKLSSFDLVYSIGKCCFIGPPKIQHFVKATLPPGRNISYLPGRVTVSGILHVGVRRHDGVVQSVYRLDVDGVKP